MQGCPPKGEYSVCERVQVGTSSYLHVVGAKANPEVGERPIVGKSQPVTTLNKDTPSILLNFEVKLRSLEKRGVPYSSVNRYLIGALDDETNVGLFNLKEMMTYGRNDTPRGYAEAYAALSQVPASVTLASLYSVVDGLP